MIGTIFMYAIVGCAIVWAGVVLYAFAMLSRYDDKALRILKNSLILCVHHLPQTIVMMIATYGLMIFSYQYFTAYIITIPLVLYIDSFIFTRIFKSLENTNEQRAQEAAEEKKAAAELAGLPLRIVYCGSLAIDEIRAVLMTRKARRELDIFFIDYLNLIHIPYTRGSRNETTDLALGDVVRKVKLMAVELDVPAVLLAQMNRDSDRRLAPYLPILSDLRNSGAIEQVADQVIFVYRAEKYGILYDKDTKEDLRGVGYLLVAKNRNGATGRARFRYNVSMTRFLSYENRLL